MNKEQKKLINKFIENPSNDIDALLLQLDDKITEIGFDEKYDLNKDGLTLQKLYDELISKE